MLRYGLFVLVSLFVISCSTMYAGQRPVSKPLMLITRGPKGREARAAAKPGLDDQTKNILAHFFKIIASFFGILQDPDNSKNVAANVTNMLASAVNMVAEGVKRGELYSKDIDGILLDIDIDNKQLPLPFARALRKWKTYVLR